MVRCHNRFFLGVVVFVWNICVVLFELLSWIKPRPAKSQLVFRREVLLPSLQLCNTILAWGLPPPPGARVWIWNLYRYTLKTSSSPSHSCQGLLLPQASAMTHRQVTIWSILHAHAVTIISQQLEAIHFCSLCLPPNTTKKILHNI